MSNNDSLEQNRQLLETLGPVWIYLKEYRLTHGYLHLLVTDESFRKLADVYFSDCIFISGPTSGGPWSIGVTEENVDKQLCAVLSSKDGNFVIRALKIRVELTSSVS